MRPRPTVLIRTEEAAAMGIFLKVYPQDELLPQGRSSDPAVDVGHPTQ